MPGQHWMLLPIAHSRRPSRAARVCSAQKSVPASPCRPDNRATFRFSKRISNLLPRHLFGVHQIQKQFGGSCPQVLVIGHVPVIFDLRQTLLFPNTLPKPMTDPELRAMKLKCPVSLGAHYNRIDQRISVAPLTRFRTALNSVDWSPLPKGNGIDV